jgi:hydroxymethylpyrimidine/phosphomethylpyrimidine kinase
MRESDDIPTILAFGGSDPTGGAGIQADIEAITSMGCHAGSVITAITVQDTANVMAIEPLKPELVMQQARAVLEDMPISVAKIGFTGSVEIIQTLHVLLMDYPQISVVLDPIINAGGGRTMADEEMLSAINTLLIPQTHVITPNTHEARILTPQADSQDASAMALLEQGADYVLITGTHSNSSDVVNVLYGNHRRLESFNWERLNNSYHGSGCTLAASLSALLAQGHQTHSAIRKAQEYTWKTLKHGYRIGMGQWLPNRLYWAKQD